LLAAACASSTKTTPETHAFKDQSGHTCEATLERTSPGTPPVRESVSCSTEGKQCSGEASPCFQLNVDRTSDEVRNCPACCKGTATSFVGTDCSPLVCEVDADCVYTGAVCKNSFCTCPDGYCE
jgi:hypothetical protein